MLAHFTVDGFSPSDGQLEGTVQRWADRLELARPLTECAVSIRISSSLFGLARRVHVELTLAGPAGPLSVRRKAKFRDHVELYSAISNTFREAYHQLEAR